MGGGVPYRGTHGVAHAEVEAALLVHGVVQAGQRGQRGPVVVEGVVPEAVVGAVGGQTVLSEPKRLLRCIVTCDICCYIL